MAKSEKSDKSIKASKRSRFLMSSVVVVLVLCVFGFFIYTSGIIPKYGTGVKILKTVDGQQVTIDNISVIETNYHYYKLLNQYAQYGYLSGIHSRDKDAVNASLLICEMTSFYKKQGKDLIDVLNDIYAPGIRIC